MKSAFISVATLAIATASHAGTTAVQWTEADGGNGHWYQAVISSEWITWVESNAAAEAAGGHLASVTSDEENQFIYGLIEPIADFWNQGQFDGPWIGGIQDTNAPDYSEPAPPWNPYPA